MFRRWHPPPGSVPGAFKIRPQAAPTLVRRFDYDPQAYREGDVANIEELAAQRHGEQIAWIEVHGLGDEAALRRIAEIFSIHPLALADIVNVGQRPKVEPYESHLLMITRMIQLDRGFRIDADQLSIVLGHGYVLTFQEDHTDVLEPVRHRIRTGALIRRMQADYLAYAILDTVIDHYYPILEELGEHMEQMEDEVIDAPTPAIVRRVHHLRRQLIELRRSIWPQRDAINSLIRDDSAFVTDSVRVYLRDSYDHAVQIVDVVETYRELAADLMDVYLTSVSNRMNEVMKVLTVISTIFIPLTFLVGVYGMNFEFMPELHTHWAYPALWIVMIGAASGMFAYFRRLGWIGSADLRRKHRK